MYVAKEIIFQACKKISLMMSHHLTCGVNITEISPDNNEHSIYKSCFCRGVTMGDHLMSWHKLSLGSRTKTDYYSVSWHKISLRLQDKGTWVYSYHIRHRSSDNIDFVH